MSNWLEDLKALLATIDTVADAIKAKTDDLPSVELGMVYLDVDSGEAGTAYPIGTAEHPVNNLADAVTIANARKLKTIHFSGFVDIAQDVPGFTFIGEGDLASEFSGITVKDAALDGCVFKDAVVMFDTASAKVTSSYVCFFRCVVYSVNVDIPRLYFVDCDFAGTSENLHLGVGHYCFLNCTFHASSHLVGLDGALNIYSTTSVDAWFLGCHGHVSLNSLTAGLPRFFVLGGDLTVEVKNTNTVGEVYAYGNNTITDNSAGAGIVINDYTTVARLGAPAGASISVDIAALKTALDALGLQYVEGSVSDAGPAAADFDTDLTEATDNHYNGMLLMFTDGVCAGQAHVINDYDGAAKNVSFSAEDVWTEAPGNGDNFIILPGTGGMAKAIYTRLGAPAGASIAADLVTIAAYLDTEIAAILNAVDTEVAAILADTGTDGVVINSRTAAFEKLVGVLQAKATTIDLQQAAGSYDLFTGTTQDVMVEKLVIRLPNVDVSDDATLTSISIQTDDTTPQVFFDATAGDVANLTAEAQIAWTGAILIKAGSKIQLTIGGGAADESTVCDVVAECRAVVSGGYLA